MNGGKTTIKAWPQSSRSCRRLIVKSPAARRCLWFTGSAYHFPHLIVQELGVGRGRNGAWVKKNCDSSNYY